MDDVIQDFEWLCSLITPLPDLENTHPTYYTEAKSRVLSALQQTQEQGDIYTMPSAETDIETLKQKTWDAIQHPHDGSVNGIDQKQKGCFDAIEYLRKEGII